VKRRPPTIHLVDIRYGVHKGWLCGKEPNGPKRVRDVIRFLYQGREAIEKESSGKLCEDCMDVAPILLLDDDFDARFKQAKFWAEKPHNRPTGLTLKINL